MQGKGRTVAQMAGMSGLTERTLRYYDQIGLLVPRRDGNGHRAYGDEDVRRLQHIMLLRQCGVGLADIGRALADPDADIATMLQAHLLQLREQERQLGRAIAATREAIGGLEAFREMNDEQRFEQLKKDSVARFEEEYGAEARGLYGDAAIDEANERMLGMSRLAWDAKEELEQRIKDRLAVAMGTGDAGSPEARMVAEMHAQWIRVHWGEGAYSPEAHLALAEGYLCDPRFVEYYDGACGEGATAFLRDAIKESIA